MYVVYSNLLYFLSIFLFTYNKNLLSQKNITKEIYNINIICKNIHIFMIIRRNITTCLTFSNDSLHRASILYTTI